MPVTYDIVRQLSLALPGVEEGTSYGTPSLKVRTKFMARLREDGESVVFKVGFDERDMLMQTRPSVFYITDHYRGYPAVLLRLSTASQEDLEDVIEMAWRYAAPKRLLAQFEAISPPD
jgi:hypothetical protein